MTDVNIFFRRLLNDVDACGGVKIDIQAMHTPKGNFKGLFIEADTIDQMPAGVIEVKNMGDIVDCLICYFVNNKFNNYTISLTDKKGSKLSKNFNFQAKDSFFILRINRLTS